MKKITVKIGSSVLSSNDGIHREIIANLVEDVATLIRNGYKIVIVSSGAVSIGRSLLKVDNMDLEVFPQTKYDKNLLREQVLAAVGQPNLMGIYSGEFRKFGLNCAQILTTRSDFSNRTFYLSLRTVTEELLRQGIVPIFNENDVLSPEELNFTDNDQLALMTSSMIQTDLLILLSDVDGVYDRSPDEIDAKLISEITDISNFIDSFKQGSHSGKGGIRSKLLCAETITSLGIPMYIASGLKKNPISRILANEQLGTYFPTMNKREEAIKCWLITAAAGLGKIVVSTYLADILRYGIEKNSRKTPSILIVGIDDVHGEFKKKDVVEIIDENGIVLGRGISRFSSNELRDDIIQYRTLSDREKAGIRTTKIIVVHANDFVFVEQ